MTDKRYYTIEEVVAHLRTLGLTFSPRTVRHWIKTGKLKALRPGLRQWYIPAEEIAKLLDGDAAQSDDAWLALQIAATRKGQVRPGGLRTAAGSPAANRRPAPATAGCFGHSSIP